MERILKILGATLSLILAPVQCSIDGISYLDPLNFQPLEKYPRGEDPCHPLYWYPRQVPDWCYAVTAIPTLPPPPPPPPPSSPSPPLPSLYPPPFPLIPPYPLMPTYLPLCELPPCPPPYGPPYGPPVYPPGQIGMVPGLPGLVSEDGGINIMPFSDAYADLLEGHKQKIIRIRLQKVLDEYDRYKKCYRHGCRHRYKG